jgi:DNA-binding transcriptional MerR regulator
MFKIGDFSKFSCVSVKMLRHYDDIGLLKPAQVDALTGYRYYSADQLPRLNRIIALKELGFTLEQIKELLDRHLSAEQLKGMLQLRRAQVAQQLRAEEQRLAKIETRLWQIEQEQRPLYDVIVRNVRPQMMATLRQTVPNSGKAIAGMFDMVEAFAASHNARLAASPLLIYHDTEYRETDIDVEVAVPLTHPIDGNPPITVRTIDGGQMACAVYTGDYDKTTEVLNAMLIWLGLHNYRIAGPLREVYLRFAADHVEKLGLPSAFITEHQHLFVRGEKVIMRYRLLGNSGLRVSELCLGTMTFGDDWGWGADKAVSQRIFEGFTSAGGNFIDTSNNYTNGTSEQFVGEFIKSQRDRYVVATKYTLRVKPDDGFNANLGGNSRKSMVRSVENSLRRLDTDYIDVLYLHMWDFMTPVEEVLRAVDDLIKVGKARMGDFVCHRQS